VEGSPCPRVLSYRTISFPKLFGLLERETGIEPATSSLGSPRERCGQRKINGLAWAPEGTKRHYWRQLNTVLNTTFRLAFLTAQSAYSCIFNHRRSASRTIGGDGTVSLRTMASANSAFLLAST
jgi:hypothetical protein